MFDNSIDRDRDTAIREARKGAELRAQAAGDAAAASHACNESCKMFHFVEVSPGNPAVQTVGPPDLEDMMAYPGPEAEPEQAQPGYFENAYPDPAPPFEADELPPLIEPVAADVFTVTVIATWKLHVICVQLPWPW